MTCSLLCTACHLPRTSPVLHLFSVSVPGQKTLLPPAKCCWVWEPAALGVTCSSCSQLSSLCSWAIRLLLGRFLGPTLQHAGTARGSQVSQTAAREGENRLSSLASQSHKLTSCPGLGQSFSLTGLRICCYEIPCDEVRVVAMDLAIWRAILDAAMASRIQASPSKAFDGLVALTVVWFLLSRTKSLWSD